jgi:hypothetical protein
VPEQTRDAAAHWVRRGSRHSETRRLTRGRDESSLAGAARNGGVCMARKKATSGTTSGRRDQEPTWNDDDFNLDSFGVEAPLRERLESLAKSGLKPEQVSEDIRERYVKYLEKMKKKPEK